MATSSLGREERNQIAENARQKLVANKAVNNVNARVNVDSRTPNEDGQLILIHVWLPAT